MKNRRSLELQIEYENLGKANSGFRSSYIEAFEKFLDSGWYINGKSLEEFEQRFAEFCLVNFCVGVANGLDALTLSLRALDLPEASEIIVPSNTYIASILAVIEAGHRPVLVEPELETYNIDPKRIEEKITSRTAAIMPVHLYGKLCRMPEIMEIANRYQLRVVEDCAQAHGASFRGRKAGSWGDVNAFSFYPTKNLGALGDAGAVTTSNLQLKDEVKLMRNYGSKVKYFNEIVGTNSRLDELQAAFLLVKLEHLDRINEHKRKLAQIYFAEIPPKFVTPAVDPDYYDVFHIFSIRFLERDRLRSWLADEGIKTDVHYPVPPSRQKAMVGIIDEVSCPIAEEIHATILSLPISTIHSEKDISAVCRALRRF